MSNPFKAIKKVFKKIVKVVKKVALPALVIGAAVLTGGAALGIMPGIAGAGGIGASLGLSSGLSSVLASAGQGALFGAIGGAATGKNILKSATAGFALGGVTGGIGQMMRPAAAAANTIGNASDAITVTNGASNLGDGLVAGSDIVVNGAKSASGVGSILNAAAPAAASAVTAPVDAVRTSVSQQQPVGTSQGIGGWLERNPMLAAGVIQGIGGGISAGAEAKSEERQAEARRRAIAENYGDGASFFTPGPNVPAVAATEAPRKVWRVDPKTGNIFQDYA